MRSKTPLWLVGLVAILVALQLVVGSVLETKASSLLVADQHLARQSTFSSRLEPETSLKKLQLQNLIRMNGGWEWTTTDEAQSRFNDATLEGSFTGTRLELRALLKGQVYELELDGAAPRNIISANTGQPGYVSLAAGLPQGEHTFRLRLVNRVGGHLIAHGLRTDGFLHRQDGPRRVRLLGFGSSTVDGSGITWKLARAKGWECLNRGIGGTTVINEGQHRVERDVLPFKPDVVLVNYGSNDWFANMEVGQFKESFQRMMDKMAAGLPGTEFVVLGIFPRQGGNETTRPLFNQAMQEALTASKAANRARYLEIANYRWDGMTTDGTHPNSQAISELFVPQILPLMPRSEQPLNVAVFKK